MGQSLPASDGTWGMDEVDDVVEQEVGGEGHHYPARDRQPPDRCVPEDFRQKKAQPQKEKSQVSY